MKASRRLDFNLYNSTLHTDVKNTQGFVFPYFIELNRIHTNDKTGKVKLAVVC